MKRTYLTLIVAMLVIGFAAVSTNLILSGTLKIGSNLEDFKKDVVFTRENTTRGDATIEDEGKSITFTTTILKNLKEQAILEYDITNKSLQYDAEISMNCRMVDETYKEYINLENSINEEFTLHSGETKTGRVTITLVKTYVGDNKSITFKCDINANAVERDTKGTYTPKEVEYEEILLNGAAPVLEGTPVEAIALMSNDSNKELIPVTIDDEGTVKRADTTTRWYSYEDKKWANAVILADGVEEPEIDEVISDDEIESYFVWIPKYKYRIFDMGHYTSVEPEETPYKEKSHVIEIEFGTKNTEDTTTECKTPGISGEDGTCSVGKWMTHPAFTTFGDIKGFWVGKFETGYNQNDDTNNVSIDENWSIEGAEQNEETPSKVIIKPNVYSWRSINAANSFYTSYNYQRELDSHMMKNTEWGAVAYLSQSEYGTCTDSTCNIVKMNNSHNFITGFAAKEHPTTGWTGTDVSTETNKYEDTTPKQDSQYSYNYTNKLSTDASTTGNYTGVYDMSGGTFENMMATDEEFLKTYTGTGFNEENMPTGKYVDLYQMDQTVIHHVDNYNFRILGDATGELGPYMISQYDETAKREISSWNNDQAWADKRFICRGGQQVLGIQNGIFAFGPNNANETYNYVTFRIVLSPQ